MGDGNMLIVTESANNTLYGCGIVVDPDFISDTGVVYLAGTTTLLKNCKYMYVQYWLQK